MLASSRDATHGDPVIAISLRATGLAALATVLTGILAGSRIWGADLLRIVAQGPRTADLFVVTARNTLVANTAKIRAPAG